jgi:uncharacterized protein DUF6665
MSRPRVPHTPAELLAEELAKEKASALGRMGGALEAALAALAAFDADHPADALSSEQRQSRRSLVGAASVALWHFIVQREACGLRDVRHVLRDYRVPAEVAAGMGILPAEPVRRRRSF